MFIPDPVSEFFHPGSRIDFFPQPGSRIQGLKKHRISDSDPQHFLWPYINVFLEPTVLLKLEELKLRF